MSQDIKCLIGLHKYEVLKEEPIVNATKDVVGKVIICRCNNCGKIITIKIITVNY